MRKALWYRPNQAVVLMALASIVMACAVFAPMYDRALQQAMVATRLAHEPVDVTGLRLSSSGSSALRLGALTTAELAAQVPPSAKEYFEGPVPSRLAPINVTASSLGGVVLWRQDECRHLRFRSGSCPVRADDIAVSSADARTFGWQPGTRLAAVEDTARPDAGHRHTFTVAGVYDVVPGDYWFGQQLLGRSGVRDQDGVIQSDYWITSEATFAGSWDSVTNNVDLALRSSSVGIDEVLFLGGQVRAMRARLSQQTSADPALSYLQLTTGLEDIADDASRGRDQANLIVSLLMTQLGLLALVVLWLVVSAAVAQRRPEVALARLRGWGPAGARSLLLRELAPAVLAGAPAGAAVALGLSVLARQVWLPGKVPSEVTSSVVWGVVAGLAALVVVLSPVWRVANQPIASLLRRVAPRSSGVAVGAGEAVVFGAAAVGFAAFATGGLSGPLAMAAPALLALAVGLLLSRLLGPAAGWIGRALLARGRVGVALGALQASRQRGIQTVLAVVTVATASFVFSADAVAVGARNREYRAEAEVGAAAVLTTSEHNLTTVQTAVAAIDPTGRRATTVGLYTPPGLEASTTLAVTPDEFRAIALFPGHDPSAYHWARLGESGTPPIHVVGSTLTATLSSVPFTGARTVAPAPGERARQPPIVGPTTLRLDLVNVADRRRQPLTLAEMPAHGESEHRVSAPIDCAKGCLLNGVTLVFDSTGNAVEGAMTLSRVSVDGHPVQVGPAANWPAVQGSTDDPDAPGPTLFPTSTGTGGLTVSFSSANSPTLSLRHASVPAAVPALVSGAPPPGIVDGRFPGSGLDGQNRSMAVVGSLPFAPGSPRNTVRVSSDLLTRDSDTPSRANQVQVWLSSADRALRSAVVAGLEARHIGVVHTATVTGAREQLDESAATWSLQLGVVLGLAALILALLVVLVLLATTWRQRARDGAALRMAGMAGRTLARIRLVEQLVPVVVAVVAGAACGLAGARFSLPTIPLFASPPILDTLDTSTAWPASLAAAVAALTALCVTAWLVGRQLASSSHLERVREPL